MSQKGKGKAPAGGPQPRWCPVYRIVLSKLGRTYEEAMAAIPVELERIIRNEAPTNSKGKSYYDRANGKVYTAENGGTFLVQIMPTEDSPEADILTLQYRWKDLYFVGFHVKGTWFMLKEDYPELREPLPPQSQVRYYETKGKGPKGVIQLSIGQSYAQLGSRFIQVGPKAFRRCYDTLMKAHSYVDKNQTELLKADGALALPAATVSEALRFLEYQGWVIKILKSNKPFADQTIPRAFANLFLNWVKTGKPMFFPNPPPELKVKLGIVKKTVRFPFPRKGTHDDEASSSGSNEVEGSISMGGRLVRMPLPKGSHDKDAGSPSRSKKGDGRQAGSSSSKGERSEKS